MFPLERLGRAEAIGVAWEALARVGVLGFEGLRHEDLAGLQREVRGVIDQAELLCARMLREQDRSGGYRADGAPDLTAWMVSDLRMSPEAAQDRVTVARSLEKLPATADLLEHGELNFEQATVVARNANKVRPEDVSRVEGMVLTKALTTDAGQLRRDAAAAVAEVDREALSRDAARVRERRSFNIRDDLEGTAQVSGNLTSELATLLRAGMEPFLTPAGPDDPRTPAQRRHDALLELVRRGVDGGKPGERRPKQLVVVAPLSAMRGEDGPPALLQGLVPLSQEELSEIACDSVLSVVLRDAKGNIVYAGKGARTFSPAKRRAMLARQATCAFERCSQPAVDCVGHHIVEYSLGGKTIPENEAPLCHAHEAMVHRDGWWVRRNDDGTYTTLPPGHPENPSWRLTPEAYLRGRERAIQRRKRAKAPAPEAAREPARAGPLPP